MIMQTPRMNADSKFTLSPAKNVGMEIHRAIVGGIVTRPRVKVAYPQNLYHFE
jgi:hypothetical protein